jgi:hypothetical protein
MPRKPVAMITMPESITGRTPWSSASLPNTGALMPQVIMAIIYGSVAVARDQPKSTSMGCRSRLKMTNDAEVNTRTLVVRASTALRESCTAASLAWGVRQALYQAMPRSGKPRGGEAAID